MIKYGVKLTCDIPIRLVDGREMSVSAIQSAHDAPEGSGFRFYNSDECEQFTRVFTDAPLGFGARGMIDVDGGKFGVDVIDALPDGSSLCEISNIIECAN